MTLEQILQQGGLVAVCGMLIYLLREQGKRIVESNATWVELGKLVERLAGSVERIEHRLDRASVCPVTAATSDLLLEVGRQTAGTAQQKAEAIVREQVRRFAVAADAMHDGQ